MRRTAGGLLAGTAGLRQRHSADQIYTAGQFPSLLNLFYHIRSPHPDYRQDFTYRVSEPNIGSFWCLQTRGNGQSWKDCPDLGGAGGGGGDSGAGGGVCRVEAPSAQISAQNNKPLSRGQSIAHNARSIYI